MNRRNLKFYSGCLLGGAIGDALGAPVEFLSLSEIRSQFGRDGITDLAGGEFTDDTQMTLFTAEGLLRADCRLQHKGISNPYAVVYHAYIRWLHTQGEKSRNESFDKKDDGWLIKIPELHRRRAPGHTCRAALRSGVMGTMAAPINDSKGCGGVMRIAPVGLFVREDRVFDMGCEIAATTHGHPSGHLAAGCLASIISTIIAGSSLEEAISEAVRLLEAKPDHEECLEAIDLALACWRDREMEPSPETVEHIGAGWVAEEALAISVYCSLAADGNFAKGVRLSVNHSGDSDSTGAITGNILGTLLGRDAIPAGWLEQLQMRNEIEEIARDLLIGFRDDDSWWEKYPGWSRARTA